MRTERLYNKLKAGCQDNYDFDQRALAAFFAIDFRFFADRVNARALPPLLALTQPRLEHEGSSLEVRSLLRRPW